MSLESLYQQVILDHYKNPRNFGEITGYTVSVAHENPLCGDHIKVALNVEEGQIARIHFWGKGCAISQASASIMTETVKGRSLEEAESLVQEFRQMMRGEKDFVALDEGGELEALKGVRQFPVRIKCAVLAWDALEQCLRGVRATRAVGK